MNARNQLLDLIRPLSTTGAHRPGSFPGTRAYRTELIWTAVRSFGGHVPAPVVSLPCPRCGKALDGPAHQVEQLVPFWFENRGTSSVGLWCRAPVVLR